MLVMKKTVAYLVLVAVGIAVIFPIFWVFITSIKPTPLAFHIPPVWRFTVTATGYASIVGDGFLRALFNSLFIAIMSTALAMLLGTPASYALSRFKFKGKTHLQFFILSLYFLPTISTLIPLLIMWNRLGLLGSYFPQIVGHALMNLPLVILVLKGFIDDVPQTLEEAALIDGCPRWKLLMKITLPLIAPGLAAVAILGFIFSWNEYMLALMLSGGSTQTVPVVLKRYITPAGTAWARLSAASVVGALVPVIFIMLVQSQLVRGMTLGAMKE